MALVLCTGVDFALITTRRLILQKAGHKVITAGDESAVASVCQQHAFDVAVICQGDSTRTKRKLAAQIRKYCPAARILELYRANAGKVLESADCWLEVPAAVPQDLADRVTALAAKAATQLS
jgi:uncharacterized OsmC-like protein